MKPQNKHNQELSKADSTLNTLKACYSELTPQLQKAADFILENPIEVALLSIRKISLAAGVTTSTYTRLAKEMGFLNYGNLRQVFQQALKTKASVSFGNRAQSLQCLAQAAPDNQVFYDFASSALNDLERLFQQDTLSTLNIVAPMIINAKKVYSLGFRDTFSCAHHFAYVGRIAFPHIKLLRGQEGTLLNELALVDHQDLVVIFGFAPYAMEIIQSLDILKQSGAKLVVITDSLSAPLALKADYTFVVDTHTPHFFPSTLASVALSEAILAQCVAIGGRSPLDSIRHFDKTMKKLGGYYDND